MKELVSVNLGGWVIEPKASCELGELLVTAFNEAMFGLGVQYEIAMYVGYQLVHGTNHMFLCHKTLVTEKQEAEFCKVVINIKPHAGFGRINYTFEKVSVDKIAPENIPGGWSINIAVGGMPQPVWTGFANVYQLCFGATYVPLAYVGTQTGTENLNHLILCKVTPVTRNPIDRLAIVVMSQVITGTIARPEDFAHVSLIDLFSLSSIESESALISSKDAEAL